MLKEASHRKSITLPSLWERAGSHDLAFLDADKNSNSNYRWRMVCPSKALKWAFWTPQCLQLLDITLKRLRRPTTHKSRDVNLCFLLKQKPGVIRLVGSTSTLSNNYNIEVADDLSRTYCPLDTYYPSNGLKPSILHHSYLVRSTIVPSTLHPSYLVPCTPRT